MGKKDGTSSSEGKSYQTNHTYFFVPAKLGDKSKDTTDDTNVPGAILRLGGYSDLEDNNKEGKGLKAFYPRHSGTELVGADTGQILLACNGQMLIYAGGKDQNEEGGKLYINSSGTMDVDSVGDLAVNSDGKTAISSKNGVDIRSREKPVAITSGPNQDITITAGDDSKGYGNVTTKAKTSTRQYFGEDLTYVEKDTKTFFQADKYTYTIGNSYSILIGTTFTFAAAFNLTISSNLSISMDAGAIYFKVLSMSVNGLSASANGVSLSTNGVSVGYNGAALSNQGIKLETSAMKAASRNLKARQDAIDANIGVLCNNILAIYSVL